MSNTFIMCIHHGVAACAVHLHVIHDVTPRTSVSTMSKSSKDKLSARTHNEEYCPVAMHNPLTSYEPNQLDNFDYSKIFQDESVDIDTEPRTCVTRDSTMRTSEKRSLHHCSVRSEKNQRNGDKLITLLKKVCCQLSPFLCVTQER